METERNAVLTRDVGDLRAAVASLAQRLESIEVCLKLMWGPGVLGGGPRPNVPATPEPAPRTKAVATFRSG